MCVFKEKSRLMNKKKKRGFTLVELLAVIVILAVVILIAVTAVIPRMNKAKKKALLDEALVYLNAAKEAFVFGDGNIGSRCINIADLNGEYVNKDSSDYNGVIKVNMNNDDLSYINADTNTLAYKLLMSEGGSTLEDNLSIIDNRTASVNFNNVETNAANSGLYKAEDDDGATYYYRGVIDNNWVEFAGFYWRIVRINGDGSIKLIIQQVFQLQHLIYLV